MIWSIAYWVLLAGAVGVGVYALFWDRAGFRGRAGVRCRRCWYDLTGASGDVKVEPIVCPECGKKHASRRAMRKTRRGKKWILVALVLWGLSHGLDVGPKVQKRGVWAAVPSWVLIASIHQTPKYVQDPSVEWGSIAYGNNSPLERAMRELHVRARVEGLSWFDYQLAAWLARTESMETLCQKGRSRYEGVSPRGSGYCILIERGLARGKLGNVHREWYRRLFHIEVKIREKWPSKGMVYAEVNALVPDRVRSSDVYGIPGLRMRIEWGGGYSYTRHQHGAYWEVDPFGIGGIRNTRIRGFESWQLAINGKPWSDRKIPVPVSSKTESGSFSVRMYEDFGYQGAPFNREELVGVQEVSFSTIREGEITDYVNIVDDEDVRAEIERCLEADGVYWHDMDGRWHAMFRLRLVDQPRFLGERRYTFGGNELRSLSANEGLAGQAWWALEPDPEKGWTLVHGGEYVPMYGWADETIVNTRYPDLRNLSIKTNPVYCLRDDEAKTVIDGRLRLKVQWERVKVYTN